LAYLSLVDIFTAFFQVWWHMVNHHRASCYKPIWYMHDGECAHTESHCW